MNETQGRSLLSITLMAALADGSKDPREQAALKELAGRIGEGRFDFGDVYDDVLVRRLPLAEVVKPLDTPALRQQAFEAAVAIANADGARSAAEEGFLQELAGALGMPAAHADRALNDAGSIAGAAGVPAASGEPPRATQPTATPNAAELDKQILDAAITNAALELLPESLASMAILPLQVRLVYRIGQAYGYALDQGHIKEFVATLGVGLTGQYLEQFGRKLLGGILGGVIGGMGRSIGHQAASSGMSFATTWAIGQVARQYYAGGRTLDAASLKAAFAPLLAQGQDLIGRYGEEIRQRAQTIDLRNLPALISRS